MEKTSQTRHLVRSIVVALGIFLGTSDAQLLPSQDNFEHPVPTPSGLTLDLVPIATLPDPLLFSHSPAHDRRLYVSSSVGPIYTIEPNANGTDGSLAETTLWFDIRDQVEINQDSRSHGGLRAFAFHPEFETNGKFYVSSMIDRPDDPSTVNYLGTTQTGAGINADSALIEFTFDHGANEVMPNSARELFRVQIPVYDHPIKQIRFNPFAEEGDEDYGLLYVNHGDAAVQSANLGGGQNLDEGLGKVLRIDPLAAGDQPYSIPESNPFASATDGTLPEIYASGFRNPHNISFALDAEGDTKVLVADIGRAHIEEVNIVEAGGNYGWSTREGPLVHLQQDDRSFGAGIEALPEDEANNNFVYPATMFAHGPELENESLAIAGSHVIANGSKLTGQYVFGDFGSSGLVFHTSFDDLLAATTTLDPNDPARDEPSELTYAEPSQALLSLGDETFETMTELLDRGRSDLRFGQGHLGELYITSKQNGTVYLVENSLPLLGDADFDGEVQFCDFLTLSRNFIQPGDWWQGDFDGSGDVGFADFLALSENFGASNLDGGTLSAVPEPSGVLIMLCGLLLVRRVHRQREGR